VGLLASTYPFVGMWMTLCGATVCNYLRVYTVPRGDTGVVSLLWFYLNRMHTIKVTFILLCTQLFYSWLLFLRLGANNLVGNHDDCN
jgi:hypothetical protein